MLTFHIPLSKGYTAKVDKEDYLLLINFKWHTQTTKSSRNFYAISTKLGMMHRHILGVKDKNIMVDHVNGDSLDNRRSNLRTCNRSENAFNQKIQIRKKPKKCKYKGVTKSTSSNNFASRITHNKIIYNLGVYNNEEDAAKAYNEAAKKYHGEFANLNIVD